MICHPPNHAPSLCRRVSLPRAEPEDAVAHFEESLAFCRGGYEPELAWTRCDYADTLRDRSGDGDREKAVHLQDASLVISRELGMRPLMERVLSRREIPGAQERVWPPGCIPRRIGPGCCECLLTSDEGPALRMLGGSLEGSTWRLTPLVGGG